VNSANKCELYIYLRCKGLARDLMGQLFNQPCYCCRKSIQDILCKVKKRNNLKMREKLVTKHNINEKQKHSEKHS